MIYTWNAFYLNFHHRYCNIEAMDNSNLLYNIDTGIDLLFINLALQSQISKLVVNVIPTFINNLPGCYLDFAVKKTFYGIFCSRNSILEHLTQKLLGVAECLNDILMSGANVYSHSQQVCQLLQIFKGREDSHVEKTNPVFLNLQ